MPHANWLDSYRHMLTNVGVIVAVATFPIASILTFGGVAGIAIGFAAQGVVSNLFGAPVIYMDQPFKIGEWLVLAQIEYLGHSGAHYSDVGRLPGILQELRAYIGNHSGIDHSQSEMVHFSNYSAHSLDILIYCFAATVQWAESLAIEEDVLLNASRIIGRHGGQLALPVTRVQMQPARPEGAPDAQRAASGA